MDETRIHHFTPKSKLSQATNDANISRQGSDLRILWCAKHFVHRLLWEKKKPSIANIYHYRYVWRKKSPKNGHKWRRKSALSPRQCTMSQFDRNNGKLHDLHFVLLKHPTYSPYLPPSDYCITQKSAPGEEIRLQWRSDIGNWGVFCGQRQILQQKRHRIVREALESVHHPKRRLCW